MPTTVTIVDRDELLEQLAVAYMTASHMIRIEHAERGSCEHREDDPAHEALHDTMREISNTILLFVDNLRDVPAIREYFDTMVHP